MDSFQFFMESTAWFLPLLIILIMWEALWKLLAMWRAARNNQSVWFVCLAIFNTAGILPIIYLLTHPQKNSN